MARKAWRCGNLVTPSQATGIGLAAGGQQACALLLLGRHSRLQGSRIGRASSLENGKGLLGFGDLLIDHLQIGDLAPCLFGQGSEIELLAVDGDGCACCE
ncbi:hypothetical protein [Devosia sp. RR2S18]|uniref:hypothetical protein n=1 Tax=Devosia rhizosphaerae TaxID=3049774 RepID=UPI00253F83C4|nr:hypothetical protein [Devosia sp. RR2S18]WIJ24024.1 hypothetical protein QOV41_13460 [Devosia sp. RR2S18]